MEEGTGRDRGFGQAVLLSKEEEPKKEHWARSYKQGKKQSRQAGKQLPLEQKKILVQALPPSKSRLESRSAAEDQGRSRKHR